MLKFLIAFLLFFVVSTSANAVQGCIDVTRTEIHTTFQNGQQYWRTSFTASSPGCLFVYTGAVCSIGANFANNGQLGDTANPQQCPIDDNISVLTIIFGGLGYFALRKNVLKLSIA